MLLASYDEFLTVGLKVNCAELYVNGGEGACGGYGEVVCGGFGEVACGDDSEGSPDVVKRVDVELLVESDAIGRHFEGKLAWLTFHLTVIHL